jgi:hypothetical protein
MPWSSFQRQWHPSLRAMRFASTASFSQGLPTFLHKIMRKIRNSYRNLTKPHETSWVLDISVESHQKCVVGLAGPCFRFRQYHAWKLETAADLQVGDGVVIRASSEVIAQYISYEENLTCHGKILLL